MEKLMQYIWQHRLWPRVDMFTVDRRRVTVIDPGQLNANSGPDFFNAKIKIGDEMWAGDVEIHVKASDWHRHGHQDDPAYRSVILHVVGKDDTAITLNDGRVIPQMRMPCAPDFRHAYDSLVTKAGCGLPCADEIKSLDAIYLHSWLDSLAYERLYAKTDRISGHLSRMAGDWESVCYITLARALGFGVNGDPFEHLAMSLPLQFIGKHSDSQLSIEALLFGQAGFLDKAADDDPYITLLKNEYAFLSHKFSLKRTASPGWKMSRMRPANFPHRRIAFLASLLFGGFKLMSRIIDATSVDNVRALFNIELAGYWARHYSFNSLLDEPKATALGRNSVDILVINVVVPLLYAYAMNVDSRERADHAINMLHELKAESNSIVAMFASSGIECTDAFTSQALIQLRRQYCETRKCLYCRIGHRMLSKRAKNKDCMQ
ncbi:MAG TPA: DUF2851 family protein [Muribaculum sp.]|uniref:DUF2851 family protein n=1 Tax=Heminiphilus faecis TaxID=2601703 RepID=UPI000EF5E05E|nr:DUF2851 family protein [Heminiphilus faecis]RLT77221.1 DUF2851 family protein [bacterium J10(2018)]HRF68479.1 DUF2851 family protein [Muribaculum sp.]